MAPTSLNKGRGEVVLALVIVLHLILKRCLVDQWGRGGGKRAAQIWNVPNMERRNVPFWEGTQNGISRGVQ